MFEIKFLDHKKKCINDGIFAWTLRSAKKSATERLNRTQYYFWVEIWHNGVKICYKFKWPKTNTWLEVK